MYEGNDKTTFVIHRSYNLTATKHIDKFLDGNQGLINLTATAYYVLIIIKAFIQILITSFYIFLLINIIDNSICLPQFGKGLFQRLPLFSYSGCSRPRVSCDRCYVVYPTFKLPSAFPLPV